MSKKKKTGATAKAAPTDNPSITAGKGIQKPDETDVSKSKENAGQVTQSRDKTTLGRYNPYMIRRGRPPNTTRIVHGIGQLLKIMTDYITILIDHDLYCDKEQWYKTWTAWVEKGLNKEKMTVQ